MLGAEYRGGPRVYPTRSRNGTNRPLLSADANHFRLPVEIASSQECHRYPVEVNSHCVRLYFRFPLGFP